MGFQAAADFDDILGMSLNQITDELITRQPPDAQAIIRVLLGDRRD
jgi:hypothetical protein